MTNKSPAFQWYPKDFLSSVRVAEMSLEEKGAYIVALSFCWISGSLPSDPTRLARVIGDGCTAETAEAILPMFEPTKDGQRLVHERLEIERKKQMDWKNKTSKAGKASAKARQKTASKRVKISNLQGLNGSSTKRQLNGNSSSSSSSSSSLKKNVTKRNTSIHEPFEITDDMRTWAKSKSYETDLELNTEAFVDFHLSKGSQYKDWKRAWQTWIRKARTVYKPKNQPIIPPVRTIADIEAAEIAHNNRDISNNPRPPKSKVAT
jgi:uncharacterized protein YdaU (DUF1376 family)